MTPVLLPKTDFQIFGGIFPKADGIANKMAHLPFVTFGPQANARAPAIGIVKCQPRVSRGKTISALCGTAAYRTRVDSDNAQHGSPIRSLADRLSCNLSTNPVTRKNVGR